MTFPLTHGRVITCPVCGQENDDLVTVCVRCRGFLQSKVDTLDLFQTVWGVIESPAKTFRRIALARTKNYAFFLSALLGCAYAFALAWYLNLGRYTGGIFPTLGLGLLAAIPLGVTATGLAALAVNAMVRMLRGRKSLRNAFGVLAYSGVPIVLSFVFAFPVEVAIFGIYLFDSNPSPFVLSPLAYIVLMGIHGVAIVWSLILAWMGMRVAHSLSALHSALPPVVLMVLIAAAGFGLRVLRL